MAYYSKALCLQDHFERDQETLAAWERYLEVVKDIPDQKEWLPQAEARIQQLRKKLSEAAFNTMPRSSMGKVLQSMMKRSALCPAMPRYISIGALPMRGLAGIDRPWQIMRQLSNSIHTMLWPLTIRRYAFKII
jgi:hypothetical protein